MKLKLIFLSLISLSPTLALFPLVSCGKDQTSPYTNLNGGGLWTITNKSDAQYLIDCATQKCEFKGNGNDIFSSASTQLTQQERSTVLYWEYANCIATNILNDTISAPFTFELDVSGGANWYSSFGTDSLSSTGYNGDTKSHEARLDFTGDKQFQIFWGESSGTVYSSASIYYK